MSLSLWQTPLSPSVARSRLVSNAAGIALSIFFRTVFSPYLAVRALVVSLLTKAGLSSNLVSWAETIVTVLLVLNVLEAAYWTAYPAPPPKPTGPSMQPISKSSPLTRSYPPTPDLNQTIQMPLAQNRTPVKGPSTPVRQSLSQSLSGRGSPSAGLFYDPNSNASPSKVALSQSQSRGTPVHVRPAPPPPQEKHDFVLVDREEREWVENVWKGVRGKGGRVGL